ncbi:MAG: ATP-binding protein [Richelia sp. RM2_1_2]|nr:ATP-binding protein [Richelia sp. SM1_7_0]NJO65813.1 ATP-binding protein [Richelia sp. RM2_1_2]
MKKKFKLPFGGLAVAGLGIGTCCAWLMGDTVRPYDMVGVKFCPLTANIRKNNYEQSQQQLDKEYCQYEHKMLSEVWEKKQYSSLKPLPENSFIIRDIPATKTTHWWYLLSIASVGGGVLSWAKKCERLELAAHYELEGYKTQIKIFGVNSREERDFKTDTVRNQWLGMRFYSGLISQEAVNDKVAKQSEVQDATHAAALKQFDAGNSEMDKTIAENLRDAAKADKERAKLQGKGSNSDIDTTTQNVDELRMAELIKALKAHEDGWLLDLINSVKPIFLIGDMGSAKTSMAVSLGLIREKLGHKVNRIADKHLNGENSDKWNLLKTECKHDTNSSILEALQDQIERRSERINQRPVEKEQFILDEFTQLAKISKEAKELIPLFVTSTYSDTRKAKELFIGVTHSFTNASFGDGNYELRGRGWLIEKFSVDGEKPIPRVVIKFGMKDKDGNNLEDVEKTLPSWFRPELIHGHFNDSPINFDN